MIEIKNLQIQFEDTPVLKGVNLKINDGEKVVIIGPSGSGKSTIVRSISLLEKTTGGEIWMDDKLINHADPYLHDDILVNSKTFKNLFINYGDKDKTLSEIKANHLLSKNEGNDFNKLLKEYNNQYQLKETEVNSQIGMVFQQFNLFNNLTVIDNLTLAPVLTKKMTKDEANKKALELLKKIDLLDKKDVYPSKLSGGQKQRIAIIRSLMMEPKIILFDEPTSALDPEMVGEVLQLIKEVAKTGMTMVFITHEMAFAKEIADKIVFLSDGIIQEEGTPDQVFNHSNNPIVKDFLSKVL